MVEKQVRRDAEKVTRPVAPAPKKKRITKREEGAAARERARQRSGQDD